MFLVCLLSQILRLLCTLEQYKSISFFFFYHYSALQIAGSGNSSEKRVDNLSQLTGFCCITYNSVSVYLPRRQSGKCFDYLETTVVRFFYGHVLCPTSERHTEEQTYLSR